MPSKTKYGSRGEYSGNASEHPLYFRWMNMLRRCYEPTFDGYEAYGGRGVTVEPFLQVFSNYVSFVENLPNYDRLLEDPKNWQLDKDKNGGNEYSRQTIQIVRSSENLEIENARKRMPVYKVSGDGSRERFESVTEAERITGIHRGNIARSARGEKFKAGGFDWRYAVD